MKVAQAAHLTKSESTMDANPKQGLQRHADVTIGHPIPDLLGVPRRIATKPQPVGLYATGPIPLEL